jgi:hypothetical protein
MPADRAAEIDHEWAEAEDRYIRDLEDRYNAKAFAPIWLWLTWWGIGDDG